MIIAVDIGTTNMKKGLYGVDGEEKTVTSAQMKQEFDQDGVSYFCTALLQSVVMNQLKQIISEIDVVNVSAISITGMAESGLLLDVASGKPITKLLPWFETAYTKQA